MAENPTLRIVHHLHRTGGTLISKCMASMPDISLLSEVNPAAPRQFIVLDPVFQANFWLRLLKEPEADRLKDASFRDKIKAVHAAATARGDHLILRNWAYLDFFALPFADRPTNQLMTARELEQDFAIREMVTVRHPLDQWLSWCAHGGAAKASDFTFAQFAEACVRFLDRTSALPFVRYEDFVETPQATMRRICDILALEFDTVFMDRWPYYHQITGDDNDRGLGGWLIEPRPRRPASQQLLDEAVGNPDYQKLLEYYGYKH